MAAYISVPRDLANVKTKVAFNLTKRQLICFGAAALVGVPLFFVLRDVGGNTAATLGMMIVMLPAFFLGMYQKNGQPAEKLLRYYVQAKFLRPKVRPYKTCNYYSILTKEVTFRDPNLRKKTGKNSAKPSRQKSAVPRTAQQSIPMQRMFEDGTCRVKNGYYTRTVEFQDINYQLALPAEESHPCRI